MNRLNKYFKKEVIMQKLSTFEVLKALQEIKEINMEYWLTHKITENGDAAIALAKIGLIIEDILGEDIN